MSSSVSSSTPSSPPSTNSSDPAAATRAPSRRVKPTARRPPPWARRRPPAPRASAFDYGVGASQKDAFTRCSEYLFKEVVGCRGELRHQRHRRRPSLPAAPRDPALAAYQGFLRPLVRAFALPFLDRVNESADDFEVSLPLCVLLCYWSRAHAQDTRLLFD